MRNFLTLTATPHVVLDCPVKERPFGEASLTESQARALALLCRQLTIADLRRLASSEEEAHAMHAALAGIRSMLSDAAIQPR
jgi:hypothetical protein